MSCVNDHYTPEELESIFLWDCLCEALPLTAEERREIKERDYTAKTGKKERRTPDSAVHYNSIAAAKEEELRKKNREQNRRWREANKERIRAYDSAYRSANRDSINERQREYDRAKRSPQKRKRVSSQP